MKMGILRSNKLVVPRGRCRRSPHSEKLTEAGFFPAIRGRDQERVGWGPLKVPAQAAAARLRICIWEVNMPVVFVHGVNNRKGPEYDAGVLAKQQLSRST